LRKLPNKFQKVPLVLSSVPILPDNSATVSVTVPPAHAVALTAEDLNPDESAMDLSSNSNDVSVFSEAESANESDNDFSPHFASWENLDLKGTITNSDHLDFITTNLRFKKLSPSSFELAFKSFLTQRFPVDHFKTMITKLKDEGRKRRLAFRQSVF